MSAQQAPRPASGALVPAWLRQLVTLLDDAVPIPGTQQRVGLDPLIGLVPGLGDALPALLTVALFVVALRQGVPTSVLLRMVARQVLDVALGSVPVVGDVFDAFHHSHRQNVELIETYGDGRRAPGLGDKLLVAVVILLAVAAVALPFVVVGGLVVLLRGD